jgi:hypothetical protein
MHAPALSEVLPSRDAELNFIKREKREIKRVR